MRPLDFVKTPKGGLAIIKEIGRNGDASIEYLKGMNPGQEHNAWWPLGSLVVIDSLPWILSRTMRHPFGNGAEQADAIFGVKE